MGKKAGHKSTKKFAKSGQLKKTIEARHKNKVVHQRKLKKKVRQANGHANPVKGQGDKDGDGDGDEDEEMEAQTFRKKDVKGAAKKGEKKG